MNENTSETPKLESQADRVVRELKDSFYRLGKTYDLQSRNAKTERVVNPDSPHYGRDIQIVSATGKVGEAYDATMLVLYGEPDIIYFSETRSGGNNLYGKRRSLHGTYNRDTGEFEIKTTLRTANWTFQEDSFPMGITVINTRYTGSTEGALNLLEKETLRAESRKQTPELVNKMTLSSTDEQENEKLVPETEEVISVIAQFLKTWEMS